jgi:hypothetical protein
MFELLPDTVLAEDAPAHHDTGDITQVVVYRRGYQDGADGVAPVRTAWAYERGYLAGERFRKMVSGTRPAVRAAFPGMA